MNPSALKVYHCPFPKQRLGKEYDGGYVIADIPDANYSILLAGGIHLDISFEEAFLEKYNSRCVAFDGTIDALPKENQKIEFVKKNIGATNTDSLTNLHDLIEANDKIFVKMDIEGGEIPWVNSLSDAQLNKFDQIVMEFHHPFYEAERQVFDKINKNHVLVHFHGNNCCGTRYHGGVIVPNIFECTYIHKKFFTGPPQPSTDSIPSPIDMRNLSAKPEIVLNHPPFKN